MKKDAPPLRWPPLLALPSSDVTVVYLDLNHWISLAQASVGHPQGLLFVHALENCRAAQSVERVIFVLSNTHYLEMLKIKDPRQRRAIADVKEEFTGVSTLVNKVVVMELELTAVLDPFAREPSRFPTIPLIGPGAFFSSGIQKSLSIKGPDGDETERLRDRMGAEAFDAFFRESSLRLERSILRGPANYDEVSELRGFGWNPDAILAVAERRAAEEREQTLRLAEDDQWRRGRLRDVVGARELLIEFSNILPKILSERNLVLADVMSDPESARAFVRAMPSTEVAIELKTAWQRNRDKPWTANDIFDIDALSLAVPYCDVVVTEKACHHVLQTAGLGKPLSGTCRNCRRF